MNRLRTIIAVGLLVASAGALPARGQDDEKRFQEAKKLVFAEKWPEAQVKFEDFLARFPKSAFASQAVYYKSKCLGEQDGRERDAVASYKDFLRFPDRNKDLSEDAEVSIIELAMRLYDQGDKGFVRDVEARISHPDKVVRYYAAVQLSYVKEKRVADRSVPVLKQIIEEEGSAELRDRARIALLRVSPEALAGVEERREPRRVRMLRIMVRDDRTNKVEFELNIPWALADLALAAIPEEQKASIRTKGYDINTILRDLQNGRGTVFEVNDAKDGKTIKIWIE
jgi:outer membrane protein assembly factor BamD (BamD/ComL family)